MSYLGYSIHISHYAAFPLLDKPCHLVLLILDLYHHNSYQSHIHSAHSSLSIPRDSIVFRRQSKLQVEQDQNVTSSGKCSDKNGTSSASSIQTEDVRNGAGKPKRKNLSRRIWGLLRSWLIYRCEVVYSGSGDTSPNKHWFKGDIFEFLPVHSPEGRHNWEAVPTQTFSDLSGQLVHQTVEDAA